MQRLGLSVLCGGLASDFGKLRAKIIKKTIKYTFSVFMLARHTRGVLFCLFVKVHLGAIEFDKIGNNRTKSQ